MVAKTTTFLRINYLHVLTSLNQLLTGLRFDVAGLLYLLIRIIVDFLAVKGGSYFF